MPSILHFEDDKLLGEMYRRKFKQIGYSYDSYESPPADIVETVSDKKPDLILSNINMPNIDGWQLIKMLKADQRTSGIPFIFLTTQELPENIERGMDLGAAAYFVKADVTPDAIVDKIKKFLPNAAAKKIPKKILHFEDDKNFAELYHTKFTQEGFEEIYYTSPAPDPVTIVLKEKPDLIIMDITMPFVDGFEATRRLKQDPRTANLPIFGFSNLAQANDISAAKKVGMEDYWDKSSTTPMQVITNLKKFLGWPVSPTESKDK